MVEDERVAVGVVEDRLTAEARIEHLDDEGDSLGLEWGACGLDVVDLEGDRRAVGARLGLTEGAGVHDGEREVAGLIDELHLMIGAVALGEGTPVFDGAPAMSLRSIEIRRWDDSANVLVRYAAGLG